MNGEAQENIADELKNMAALLGLSSELQLSDFFNISPTTISKWKIRGKIPKKYREMIDETIDQRIDAIHVIDEVHVSVQEVMEAMGIKQGSRWIYTYKKKNPKLYQIIEDGIRVNKLKATKFIKGNSN